MKSLPSLASELKVTLSRRMALAAVLITLIFSGLHLGWTLYQRTSTENKLRDALAQSLQGPLYSHNLPAVRAILHAFGAASLGAEICVHLPDGDWLKEPQCGQAAFESYQVNLSKDQFSVSVTLPILDRMVFFGIPFGLAILFTLLLVSRYLHGVSRKVLSDLGELAGGNGASKPHYSELAEAAKKIERVFTLQRENLTLVAHAKIGTIASMVGHDIRTPVETLEGLSDEVIDLLPVAKQRIFKKIISRISNIADDLLEIEKATQRGTAIGEIQWPPQSRQAATESLTVLKPLVEDIVLEKQSLYQKRQSGVEIKSVIDEDAEAVSARLFPDDFYRVVSNLINNAAEAITGAGLIEIRLKKYHDTIELTIRDTGCGIPLHLQSHLMEKGNSFGKNGNGLGLFHAKQFIHSCGGSISVESAVGLGTTVKLQLPVASDVNLGESLECADMVLIDDSTMVHDSWSMDAESQGLRLAVFDCPSKFLSACSGLEQSVPIFIDKNLGREDGLRWAGAIVERGFSNVHVTTGERPGAVRLPGGVRSVIGKRFPMALPVA